MDNKEWREVGANKEHAQDSSDREWKHIVDFQQKEVE